MQGLRHQPLAGAVFAGNQHVGIGRADARNHIQHRPHGRRLRDQLWETLGAQGPVFLLEPLPFAQRAPQLDLSFENGREPRVVPGLLNEIAGPAPHGLHGQLDRPPGRHHDHRQVGVEGLNAVEQVKAFLAGGGVARVVEVHQDGVEIARFNGVQSGRGRSDGLGLITFALDEEAEGFEDIGLIVGDEDGGRAGVGRFHLDSIHSAKPRWGRCAWLGARGCRWPARLPQPAPGQCRGTWPGRWR